MAANHCHFSPSVLRQSNENPCCNLWQSGSCCTIDGDRLADGGKYPGLEAGGLISVEDSMQGAGM